MTLLALPATVSFGQERSTPSPLAQKGIRHAEQGRYRQAINALEDAWERNPTDPVVAEHLALSYLYEEFPPSAEAFERANELMRFSIENGGQASVPARHLHKGWKWVSTIDDSCPGRLVLKRDGVHFLAATGKHSYFVRADEFASVSLSKDSPRLAGILHVETSEDVRHRMRTGTKQRNEARILVRLIRELIIGG